MEHVAAEAGVSRAPLYRHFRSKRDLLLPPTSGPPTGSSTPSNWNRAFPSPSSSPPDSMRTSDYFVENRHTVLAANRELAGDPVIQAIIHEELAVLRHRLLDATGLDSQRRQLVSVVVMSGWCSSGTCASTGWPTRHSPAPNCATSVAAPCWEQ